MRAGTDTSPWRWRAWVPPLAVLFFFTALDLVTGPETYFGPYLLLAPAVAALTGGPGLVLLVGGLALPVRHALAHYDTVVEPTDDKVYLYTTGAFALATVVLATFARLRLRRERQLLDLTSVALAAQHTVLRPLPREVDGVRVGVRFLAAAAEAQIGGDLYDVISTPFGVRAVIGDVRGKGLTAVHAAAVVLGSFREAGYDEPSLAGLAHRVEVSVTRHVPQDEFITALFVEFGAGELTLLHRGHVPALLIGADGTVAELRPPAPAPPLGLGHLVPVVPTPWTVPYADGDVLVLVTDGVTEARREGRFYPLADRLAPLVGRAVEPAGTLEAGLSRDVRPVNVTRADTQLDLDAAAGWLRADLLRYTGGGVLHDDAVILLLAR